MTRPDIVKPADETGVAQTHRRRRGFHEVSSSTMAVLQVLLGLFLLLIWQFLSDRVIDSFMISNPVAVIRRLWGWTISGSIFVHVWATVYATLMGFLIGAVAGIIGGLCLGLSPFLSRLFNPYIWAFNALPKVALAPLLILWFGLGIESKIALAATLVVFLVFVNTFAGVREVDQELVDSLRLMRARKHHILTMVVLPSATSWIFVGIKTSIPYALIGTILGEMIAANRGLGYLVQRAGSEFDTAGVFAALVVIAVFAAAFNEAVVAVQTRLQAWKVVGR